MGPNTIRFIKGKIDTVDLHCYEKVEDVFPDEFFLSIRALNNRIAVPIDSIPTVHIPSFVQDEIHSELWFESGIQTRFTIPREGNHGLKISLKPHPFLTFGFFIQITPNSWLPNGIVFQVNPNSELRHGVTIILQFLTSTDHNGEPYIQIS